MRRGAEGRGRWSGVRGQGSQDGCCGGCGVGGGADGAADDEPVGACLDRFAWREGAALIVCGSGCGADAGGDQLQGRGEEPSEGGEFEGGAHQAANAGTGGEHGKTFDVRFDIRREAQFDERRGIEACENSDGEDEGRWAMQSICGFACGGFGGMQHRCASAGVDREHLDVEVDGGGDGFGDGVGDVVEFEVEEDGGTEAADFTDDVGSGCGEEFLPDFEGADCGADALGEVQCGVCGRDIEGDDDRVVHGGGD